MIPPPKSMRPPRLVFPALAAAFLLSFATGESLATGPPDEAAPAVTDNATGAVPSATDNVTGTVPAAADNSWVDRTHSRVEKDLFDTVVWFDRFFGDERMEVTERPASFLRWATEIRWDQEEHYSVPQHGSRLPAPSAAERPMASGDLE